MPNQAEVEACHLTSEIRELLCERGTVMLYVILTLSVLASKHRLYIGSWTCPVPHEPQQPHRVTSSRGSVSAEAVYLPR